MTWKEGDDATERRGDEGVAGFVSSSPAGISGGDAYRSGGEADRTAVPPSDVRLSGRGLFLTIALVVLWSLGSLFAVVSSGRLPAQQFLLVIGFGAVLTVLLLQWPKLFLGSVILVYGGSWGLMFATAPAEDYRRLLVGLAVSFPVFLFLAWMAWALLRQRLRRDELVIIYACVLLAIPWCFCIKAVIESSVGNLFEVQRNGEPTMYQWARALPWWAPTTTDDLTTTEAVRGFARGNGGRVPWGLWWRPLLYWSSICLAFEAMIMGLLLMFRRTWIEQERLPMPWTYPAVQLIRGGRGSDRGQPPSISSDLSGGGVALTGAPSRATSLPFLIGLAICLPAILLTSPTGEALGTWVMPPWIGSGQGLTSGFDLTGLNLIPGVSLRLYWCPLVLCLMLLFPMDLLLTTALTYIVFFLILPPLSTGLGFQLGPQRLSEFTGVGLRLGGGAGLLVWSLWFNRREIAAMLGKWPVRSARVTRNSGGRNPDRGGAGSPDHHQRATHLPPLLFALGLIAFFTLGCYATSAAQMVFVIALVLIFCFWQVRLRAEGVAIGGEHNLPSHMMNGIQRSLLHDHPTLATKADAGGQPYPVTPNSWGAHWFLWGFASQLRMFGPHNMLLEAFKVGHDLAVPPRRIARAVVWTLLGVSLIAPLVYVQLMYLYGFENSYSGELSTWVSFTQWSERAAKYGQVTTSDVFIRSGGTFLEQYQNVFFFAAGLGIIGALFYFRREYPQFLIHPVGVVVGVEVASTGAGGFHLGPDWVWFSFLLAGLAKLLVFRWLGIRTFREKIQPILVLLICGMIYGMMLYYFRQLTFGVGALK